MYEAPATAGFGEGQMYLALPTYVEKLFLCLNPWHRGYKEATLQLHLSLFSNRKGYSNAQGSCNCKVWGC